MNRIEHRIHTLLDLHSAHPLRDLVMFFRIDNDIRSLKAPLGLHDDAV